MGTVTGADAAIKGDPCDGKTDKKWGPLRKVFLLFVLQVWYFYYITVVFIFGGFVKCLYFFICWMQ